MHIYLIPIHQFIHRIEIMYKTIKTSYQHVEQNEYQGNVKHLNQMTKEKLFLDFNHTRDFLHSVHSFFGNQLKIH